MRTTRLVYIAHPLGAGPDRAENIERASRWFAWAARQPNVIPVASWITLARLWPETDENRSLGMLIDKQLIARCDEVWLCGPRVSPGMAEEARHAVACGIVVWSYVPADEPEENHVAPTRIG